jgi:hypothetical protein
VPRHFAQRPDRYSLGRARGHARGWVRWLDSRPRVPGVPAAPCLQVPRRGSHAHAGAIPLRGATTARRATDASRAADVAMYRSRESPEESRHDAGRAMTRSVPPTRSRSRPCHGSPPVRGAPPVTEPGRRALRESTSGGAVHSSPQSSAGRRYPVRGDARLHHREASTAAGCTLCFAPRRPPTRVRAPSAWASAAPNDARVCQGA